MTLHRHYVKRKFKRELPHGRDILQLKSPQFIDGYRKCQCRRLTHRLRARTEEAYGGCKQSLPQGETERDHERVRERECCGGRESGIYFIISSFRIAAIVRDSAY